MPDADALAHSAACAAMIRDAIRAQGGTVSFATFMELALYAPGLGYYAAGARKFGPAGDFITAPEISPLFGQCVARAIADNVRDIDCAVMELGPGSGKLACDVLTELGQLGALPEQYWLLEVSADLKVRQKQALAQLPDRLSRRVRWLDKLPEHFAGVVVANEVLDVVPVHILQFVQGDAFERCVALDQDERFVWNNRALPADLHDAAERIRSHFAGGTIPEGYVTEVSPAVDGLMASLADMMLLGAILLVDYGFCAREFYHPSRATGTLMCHYRHYAHTDPFLYPGLQDITAHVDFTRVAEVASAHGMDLINYSTQAQFLMNAGITELISHVHPSDATTYLPLTNQLQRLMSPAEMGEFFKVIGFCKDAYPMAALSAARPLPL